MTRSHAHVFTRYLGASVDDADWIVAGCRGCLATIKFPANAKLALKHNAMADDYAAGMSATEIATKHGYKSRGMVVNLLEQLGVEMRSHAEAKQLSDSARAALAEMPPTFDPHEPIEPLAEHYAECHRLRIPSP